jgi:uncharacterized membrane protein
VPQETIALAGAFIFLVMFIGAYVYRARAQEDDLVHNHMTYIIRTTWIAGLFFTIGFAAAIGVVYSMADISMINEMMRNIQTGQLYTKAQIRDVLDQAYAVNQKLLIVTGAITLGPSVIYLVIRIAKGMARAMKGYRMAEPRAWF